MNKFYFAKRLKKLFLEKILLGAVCGISIVLLIAAGGKFFYPAKAIKNLEYFVSGCEILLIILMIFFRKQWKLWAALSLIFASWAGYAFYWHSLELPCSCMGEKISIPTFLSIALDLIFYIVSLVIALFLILEAVSGKHKTSNWITELMLLGLGGLFCALVGYAFADWIYHQIS